MEFRNVAWSTKQLNRMVDNGIVKFDYPIQRSGGQWKDLQKSYLIHSLAQNFPIPPIYFLGEKQLVDVLKKGIIVSEEKVVRYVLDGKQRLSVIKDFSEDIFKLDSNTPDVEIEGECFIIAGKFYSELDEEVVDMISSRNILTYTVDRDSISDDEIEELFYRMNNGVTLTVQQKSKARMGIVWATKLNELGDKEFFRTKCSFSKNQLRTEAHHTAILQSMMMLDSTFVYANASQRVISNYAETLKESDSYKEELFEKVCTSIEYLNNAFDKKESLLLKKVNFPMTVLSALFAMESGIDSKDFYKWSLDFKKAYKGESSDVDTDYVIYTGTGSVKKEKVDGRMDEMKKHLGSFLRVEEVY